MRHLGNLQCTVSTVLSKSKICLFLANICVLELGFANSFDWKHDVWQTERTFLALHNITCKIPSLERGILKKSDLRGILCYYCRSYCDRAKPGLSQKSTWKLLCLWWLMSHPITSAMSTFNAFAFYWPPSRQGNQLYLLKQLKASSMRNSGHMMQQTKHHFISFSRPFSS